MIDTRALAQEVQDQLLEAVHRGQEQFRKGQDQLRKSQYHMRKSREALAEAVRTGNELAKSIRPDISALPWPTVRIPPLTTPADRDRLRARSLELADQVVATQRHLADRAVQVTTPLAEQVIATQRQLADRALHAASPVVADSVAKLTHAVGTLPGMRRLGLADGIAAREAVADREESAADGAIAEVRRLPTTAAESDLQRPKTSKPRTPRASTKAASTTKAASSTKTAGTSRAAGTRKPRATKAAGTTKTTGTSKPRATKTAGSTRTAGTRKPRSTKS